MRDGASRSHVPREWGVSELLLAEATPHLHTAFLTPQTQIGYESQNTTTVSSIAASQHPVQSFLCSVEQKCFRRGGGVGTLC
jgi:hypothetical protein